MGWRVARSLEQLRAQANAAWPGRLKSADGTIGDPAHQSTSSDHNPDASGVVRALDLTQDPAHGADMGALAESLRQSRDDRIKYVIWNRRIFSSTVQPWVWRTYTGADPHTGHLHISVVADGRADNTRPWAMPTGPQGGDEMDQATFDRLVDTITVKVTENVTCGIRRGAWRDGFLDATLAPGYRGGPTLEGLDGKLGQLLDRTDPNPVVVLDYPKLAKALLDELDARARAGV